MSPTRRAMRLSIVDALFYALMVGFGEAYFLADAVRLGASPLVQALVLTVPLAVGAIGPLLALAWLLRFGRRKSAVVSAALMQVLILTLLALSERERSLTPVLLVWLATLYQACGQAAGTLWSSWYGDLVPSPVRGRYFARRSRAAQVATGVALLSAGILLQRLEPAAAGVVRSGAGGQGFTVVFAAAALFRLVSVITLVLAPEPTRATLMPPRAAWQTLRPWRGNPLVRLLGASAAIQLFVYLASPYFGPFMLEQLRLSYLAYTAGNVAVVLLKFVSLPAWGRVIDHYGARPVYLLAAVLVAVVPLPWLGAHGVIAVVLAQMLSGFAWGGYEVAHFSLLLEQSDSSLRPYLFASLNLLNGTAQLLGSVAGGGLLRLLQGRLRWLFGVSALARLLVALALPAVLPPAGKRQPIGRRRMLLRVVGFRASGGIDHRPLPQDSDDE